MIYKEAVYTLLRILGINCYFSYDEIRKDSYKLHAPFDGVFAANISNEILYSIYESVKKDGAKLSYSTRKELKLNKIITFEVKSTRLSKKYKERSSFFNYQDENSVKRLLDYLSSLDYITYPYFTRYGDFNYFDYCMYVNKKFNLNFQEDNIEDEIKKIELKFASDIYMRVFVDEDEKKFVLMGWMTKWKLLDPPEIQKLYKTGKSEIPIYFTKSIKKGSSFDVLKLYIDSILLKK